MVSIGVERAPGIARLEATALANAATTVAVAAYLICAALLAIAPDALLWVFQSWFHGLTLDPLRPAGAWFRPTEFVIGVIMLGAVTWLVTAATARLYNTWSGR
jgi:hypothetical protein